MEKIIKPIENFPGYFVSNYGEVYSLWDRTAGSKQGGHGVIGCTLKRLREIPASGRWMVGLYKDKKRHCKRIHGLVLTAFVSPRPAGMQACHFPDRDTHNNRIDNLRWDTAKSNAADKVFHHMTNDGERNGSAKLKQIQVVEILSLRKQGWTHRKIADLFGVSLSNICMICTNKIWKTIRRD